MPPQFGRLGILAIIFAFLCFSAWRFSHHGIVSDSTIGKLSGSGSGHIIDAHGDYIQGYVPPIHDTSHKHDYNANAPPPSPPSPPSSSKPKGSSDDIDGMDPDDLGLGSDLAVGDGGKGQQGKDNNKIYVTVTVKEVETKTVTQDRIVTGKPSEEVRTTATATSSISRRFERYAGLVEDYNQLLTPNDQKILGEMQTKSSRQDRLRRMYDLNGADEWLQFIKDQDDAAMPPFTKFAQEYIYNWQHPDPSDCKNRKFLVLHHNRDINGLGTVVHGTGWVLGLAMRHGRILIYDDEVSPGQNFLEPDCQASGVRSLDCIFLPLSSCSSTHHLTEDNHLKLESYWRIPLHINMSAAAVPPLFGQMLKNNFPEMHPDAMKYWWRSQAAAYMMRMNRPALERLKALRLDDVQNTAVTHSSTGELVDAKVPFPLPDGSFSMHVRHGDKGIEMELIPFRKYVDRAEEYAAMNMIMTKKTCFISTEDIGVIEEAKQIGNAWISPNTTSNPNWTWIWSNIPRINGGPVEQLNKFGNRTDMTIKWMLQMFFAIEAPHILGTRGSGWNRMIDELRCIWVDCRGSYMEVGPFEDWVHYNF
ncbi:hypothetical protein TWF703_005954 [Orbilia oligospora]|uniref:Uncharacterized protein n=2 Tax=Orbilia oligospora TaxID=2813651 RepID=A0A7C8NI51_ORBOL|nr:hypothetical protein TWF703_005954 [Orbilia oligospora]